MFKQLTVYRIGGGLPSSPLVEAALSRSRFTPCMPTQEKVAGWVAPRNEEHGALLEIVAGQRIMKMMIETKAVPGNVVKQKAQEAADHIEATTGRKPGKKETRELREDALLALLPQAFPRQSSVLVWVDPDAGLLLINTVSQRVIGEVVTALVRAFDGLSLALLSTTVAPRAAMIQWLMDTAPGNFSVERECELKSSGEEKSVVKFNRHSLARDQVSTHIAEGKLPVRLAMSWAGRMSFVLTEGGQLKKLVFLDGTDGDGDDSGFDADVILATGELQGLIPDLVAALGGEVAA